MPAHARGCAKTRLLASEPQFSLVNKVILNTKDLIRSLLSNEITIILMMVAFSHGLAPHLPFAIPAGSGSVGWIAVVRKQGLEQPLRAKQWVLIEVLNFSSGARSLLRHPSQPKAGEIGGFKQLAHLWHPPRSRS